MFEPTKQPSRITIPAHAHPLAKVVFSEMARQGCTYDALEYYSGVLRSTLKAWRQNNKPGLDTIEAALGVLGWSVLPVPRAEILSEELRADLEAVAEKHGTDFPALEFISAAVGRRPSTLMPYSTVEGPRPVTRMRRTPQQQSLAA